MIRSRFIAVRAASLASLALVTLSACRSNAPAVVLPSFQDLSTATSTVQQAAKAVVRIHTAGEDATGSFLSSTGLLLTNNHVLGIGICPTEGCSVELRFDYQRGEQETVVDAFVVPLAVSVGLDMALVQAYESSGGPQLSTPNFLTIESHDPADLIGTHVTIVGHPLGDLKQWTAGDVYDTAGNWVFTSAYILPGNSGSPMLNDAGKLVAIIHREPTAQYLDSSVGADTYSIGTASSLLVAAMSAPLPPEMIATSAPIAQASLVANDLPFLNGQSPNATLADGTTTSVLSALGSACDAALAVTDYAAPEDQAAAFQPCYDGELWIECRSDVMTSAAGTVCPDGDDAAAWSQRFQALNAASVALNDQVDYYAVSFAVASLSPYGASGVTAGGQSLVAALDSASTPLDPVAAYYLAEFAIPTYGGEDLVSYLADYPHIPEYALNADWLAYGIYALAKNDLLSEGDAESLLDNLAADATVDVGTKLDIETLLYFL